MNKEETERHVHDFVQRAIEGKITQFQFGGWKGISTNCIQLDDLIARPEMYRIKPEPRRLTIYIYENKPGQFTESRFSDPGGNCIGQVEWVEGQNDE